MTPATALLTHSDRLKTFLITGFPRSRTAWCANFLSYGSSFCFHEPSLDTPVLQFPRLFAQAGLEYVGASDSGAVFYIDAFMKMFPESKIVLIKREPQEVVESMARLGFDFRAGARKFAQEIVKIEKRYEVLTVPFGALPAAEIWQHCVPGQPVNQMRLQMLEDFRVTVTEESASDKLKALVHKKALL
jgi:hypothetical protein